MLLISKTYFTMSPESADNGVCEDTGFVFENEEYSFRELVEAMREYNSCSCLPSSGAVYEWLSNNPEIEYQTGEEITESIHFSKENHVRKQKYWAKAMYAAGIIKSLKG